MFSECFSSWTKKKAPTSVFFSKGITSSSKDAKREKKKKKKRETRSKKYVNQVGKNGLTLCRDVAGKSNQSSTKKLICF